MALFGPTILLIGVVAGFLMIATEFSTLFEVKVLTASCSEQSTSSLKDACETTGGEQHSYALVLLGLLTLVMAFGAGPGASRPAALGLLVCGGVVLGIAIIGDLPDSTRTGLIGQDFEQAKAVRDSGITLELLGGGLAVAAGLVGLVVRRR